MSARAVQPGSARAWLCAVRPRTLTAAAAPVAIGAAVAESMSAFALAPVLVAFAAATLIQVGTNFVNDAADFVRGTDDASRRGPKRAAAAGLLTPSALWFGAAASFGLAALLGVLLIVWGGWPILAIGLVSIACGVAYTAGPAPLAYLGIADAFVFAFFGVVAVSGTVLVQAGEISLFALWAGVPCGALATAMLAINNLRDREGDARNRKRTIAVRFGRRAAVIEIAFLYALAYATPLALAIAYAAPTLLLPVATLSLAARPLVAVVTGSEGEVLSAALAKTALLLLIHSLLFAVGIALC